MRRQRHFSSEMFAVEETFIYQYTFWGRNTVVNETIRCTCPRDAREIALWIMKKHDIPEYVEDDLVEKLTEFIEETVTNRLASRDTQHLERYLDNSGDDPASQWAKLYKDEHAEFAQCVEMSDEKTFSQIYHTLIHSPALETLFQLEHGYAFAVSEMLKGKVNATEVLEKRIQEELTTAMAGLGSTHTENDINQITREHTLARESVGAHWASELSQIQETQKREYRDFVVKLHDDILNNELGNTNRTVSSGSIIPQEEGYDETPPEPRMEESFTIYLGSQLKTMHNMRLLCCDVLDLCRHSTTFTGGVRTLQPHRLQTAMSLYSEKLSALILLVDGRINSLGENKKVFAEIAHQSTDFHFPDIDVQINAIRQLAQTIKKDSTGTPQRNGGMTTDENGLDVPSCLLNTSSLSDFSNDGREPGYNLAAFRGGDSEGSGGSELGPAGFLEHSESVVLSPGDIYVTRHSNLSEVHVVFHLVTEPSLSMNDIAARHPVMVGLRNCLHAASHHDIHTITIPLLMVHKMSPEMTINWCLKRAELVMKCVKGFMMESTLWGGSDARTIQFVVPTVRA